MNKKYEITDITMEFGGRTLYRIRALKDFSDVKKGELGGWVSNENNLSQYGDCWIYNEAKCMDYSRIYDNGIMYDNSIMFDNSEMHGDSTMYEHSRMYDHSAMYGCSELYGDSILEGDEELY